MNKFVGYMNIVLLTVTLIGLAVGSVQFQQRELLIGLVMMLVPFTLTMFAMEPQPRCLHAALIANTVVIGAVIWGAGASPSLVPFLINMAALVRVWIRVKDLAAGYLPKAAQAQKHGTQPPDAPPLYAKFMTSEAECRK